MCMLSINPTISTNFSSQNKLKAGNKSSEKPQKLLSEKHKFYLTLTALAAVGAGAIRVKKGAVTPFYKALEKNGLELRKNVVYHIGTDKKFTGSIKRNSKSLGREKEITKYVNGVISEKLWYDAKGREFKGHFYKNGKLFRLAHSSRCYKGVDYVGYTEYNEKLSISGKLRPNCSMFEEMRKDVPDYIELDKHAIYKP